MSTSGFVSALVAELGPRCRVITDGDLLASYRQDMATVVPGGLPAAVVLPRTVADVSAALSLATRFEVPVVPRGAGTSLAGGASAVDGCLVLSTEALTAIRSLRPLDRLAVVEAGVVNAHLDRAAAEHGLMYAPDPSSYEIATIGGNVATNAGGLRCVKYGVTRQSVLGLEVVLADGRVVRTGTATTKNVAGYDLTGLLVGSEGTLGVITAATVRLHRRPVVPPTTVVAAFASLEAAGEAVARIMASGPEVSLLELLDGTTLRSIDEWKRMGLAGIDAMLVVQVDGRLPDDAAQVAALCAEAGAVDEAAVSTDPAEAEELLAIRRLAYPAAERLGQCLVEDVGVPVSRLPEMIRRVEAAAARHGVTVLTVAHAGDGNLHPTFVWDHGVAGIPPAVAAAADEVFAAALELDGTITGEHGVGVLKAAWLERQVGPEAMALQRAVKAVFDPLGIMNPGKVLV
ncbi:FAD-binding oxidoreductase [Nocardioides nitrophenolicus]|uniref:FAD-binding oxidoreductase n=1 Tax=Nocardioides nitrophenolicus TaxID=60489 RepID=UPI0027DDDD44|nr:FAD-linked oxidase C-terminal domain-containing protein [Nocardioides nitrophenolicus]MBM7517351.1 glycolate oxidase [Nocardioides nitrophenolicus]